MSTLSPLLSHTRELLETEWLDRDARHRERVRPEARLCPAPWILPRLLEIVAHQHHEPTARLRPRIRQVVEETCFACDNAAGLSDEEVRRQIDNEVDDILDVIDRARRHAQQQWRDEPASSPMFG